MVFRSWSRKHSIWQSCLKHVDLSTVTVLLLLMTTIKELWILRMWFAILTRNKIIIMMMMTMFLTWNTIQPHIQGIQLNFNTEQLKNAKVLNLPGLQNVHELVHDRFDSVLINKYIRFRPMGFPLTFDHVGIILWKYMWPLCHPLPGALIPFKFSSH